MEVIFLNLLHFIKVRNFTTENVVLANTYDIHMNDKMFEF